MNILNIGDFLFNDNTVYLIPIIFILSIVVSIISINKRNAYIGIGYALILCIFLWIGTALYVCYIKEKRNYIYSNYPESPIITIQNQEQKYISKKIKDSDCGTEREIKLKYEGKILKILLNNYQKYEINCEYTVIPDADIKEIFKSEKKSQLIKKGPCFVKDNSIELLNDF